MTLRIDTITVGAFEENAYLVLDDAAGRAVLIDPGAEPQRLLDAVSRSGATLDAIWVTHPHVDHVGAIAAIKRTVNVPVFLHPDGERLYHTAAEQGRLFGLHVEPPPAADRAMREGGTVVVGGYEFAVMETPGHAPGHVVIHGHGVAFVGDCLFAGSIGRTDLPMSNAPDLVRSLERICELGDDVVAYPGHGPATTIGREKATNPFLTGTARIPGGSA